METKIQLNSNARLSEHFTLGEMTRSNSHPEVYNIPSHEAIENLKRVCSWLEYLRKRYNELNQTTPNPSLLFKEGKSLPSVLPSSWEEGNSLPSVLPSSWEEGKSLPSVLPSSWEEGSGVEEKITPLPIIINSGYRSPQLNRKVGGVPTSNHLTGCAVDIRVSGMEQLIQYAAILIQYANETRQDFDELLLERNCHGAIWLHLAVRPKDNRRKVSLIS